MNKYLFLDVDGVLNHELWYRSEIFQSISKQNKETETMFDYDTKQFCPWSIALLNQITDQTGAKIVVSSSWRKSNTDEELVKLFKEVGITGEVIGSTPCLYFEKSKEYEYNYSVPRGCEIKAWLEMNKDKHGIEMAKVRYLILDDDSDMLYWQRNNFIHIDPYTGITNRTVHRALQILNK